MKTIVTVASQNKKIIFEHAGKSRNFGSISKVVCKIEIGVRFAQKKH